MDTYLDEGEGSVKRERRAYVPVYRTDTARDRSLADWIRTYNLLRCRTSSEEPHTPKRVIKLPGERT